MVDRAHFPSDTDSQGTGLRSTSVMSDTAVDSLLLDLLEWIGPGARSYDEVLEAWRTSCPRLPVWEEAQDRSLVVGRYEPGRGRLLSVSAAGWDLLSQQRPGVRPV